MNSIEPLYSLPFDRYFSDTLIPETYAKVKEKVTSLIKEQGHVSITTDLWSSIAQDSYLSLTAHFIKRQQTCLHAVPFDGSHTGERIASMITNCLQALGIAEKLHVVVCDSGSNFVAGLHDGNIPNIPCLAHTLQLVVKDGCQVQPCVSALTAMARKLVGQYKHSNIACKTLQKIQDVEQDWMNELTDNPNGASDDPDQDYQLFAVRGTPEAAIILEPEVNGVTLPMELDTGASVSIISQKVWEGILSKMQLEKSDTLLKTYTGEKLQVLGQLQVQVKYGDQVQQLPLLVVAGNGPSLWGRNWLAAIRLNWAHIKQVHMGLGPLLQKCHDVFQKELGTLQGIEVKLTVREDAIPKFYKPRSVPYAMRGAIEKDLERLENLGVIDYSDWAAPIFLVPKADGSIRIWSDYKVTINPVLQVDQYPVPQRRLEASN